MIATFTFVISIRNTKGIQSYTFRFTLYQQKSLTVFTKCLTFAPLLFLATSQHLQWNLLLQRLFWDCNTQGRLGLWRSFLSLHGLIFALLWYSYMGTCGWGLSSAACARIGYHTIAATWNKKNTILMLKSYAITHSNVATAIIR